jgi:hypothetical protein
MRTERAMSWPACSVSVMVSVGSVTHSWAPSWKPPSAIILKPAACAIRAVSGS